MKKNLYIPLNLNLSNKEDSISKWYVYHGNHGSFIIGISNEIKKESKQFVLKTAL